MSSTKDPKSKGHCQYCPVGVPLDKCKCRCHPTPQATKPVDELDALKSRCEIDEYGTMGENAHWVFNQFKALLTEARIDELEWVKSRSAKHAGIWIDERNNELVDRIKQLEAQLKNERSNK